MRQLSREPAFSRENAASMKALRIAIILCLCTSLLGVTPLRTTLRGYTSQSSDRERAFESRFIDLPSAAGALAEADVIGAHPHYAGTPADYALAVWMRDTFRAYGVDADLESLTARVDTPRELALELYADGVIPTPAPGRRQRTRTRAHAVLPLIHKKPPRGFGFDLREAPEPSDPPTADGAVGLPFNAGSGDGNVTAPLVYASRGLDADYATLAGAGIDVNGAIALVRYGAQFRGLLAERAQAHGALGVIFYSDPQDDGAARGPVYPNGPWRPLTAIQRGSVGPNVHIPTLPISAANAEILLNALHGTPGPATWRGALNVDYPLARGPALVHLVVKMNHKRMTLWNTVARIRGVRTDQTVILGAHRDAWVAGVGDNGAGVITLLEVARGLGYLLKSGWRPTRSIVLAGWDGEEIGLVGSRAYLTRHRTELQRGCLAYLNADENITGTIIGADAATALAPIVVDATRGIGDPASNATSIFDRWYKQPHRIALAAPGGGSDHESFLLTLGIPTAAFGFNGPFGVYHSSDDTVRYARLFSDPGFVLHRTSAQIYGTIAMRIADADVVPYTFGGYVALLRAEYRVLRARARHDGESADFPALDTAIDRLAGASARMDAAVTAARIDYRQRELGAAQDLDDLVYGVNGYASVTFPDISAAFAAKSSSQIAGAMVEAVGTIAHATNLLSI